MRKNPHYAWVFGLALLYALLLSWGLPLWDDDYTSWMRQCQHKSVLTILWEIVSPVSTQPQFWGFNERPFEELHYKLCYLVGGYAGWTYWTAKSCWLAALCTALYHWSLEFARDRRLALAAAVFFLAAPAPMAAFMWHADFAPTAEFLFAAITWLLWRQIEQTPAEWTHWREPGRAWWLRWLGLSLLTYLSYKSKADLKLIPAILFLYLACVRPRQLALFAPVFALMGLLAVPWGKAIFHSAPPFAPGSGGSRIGWMWQPASFHRLRDFFWSNEPNAMMTRPTLSMAGVLGPFLLMALFGSGLWLALRREPFTETPQQRRALLLAAIWASVATVGVSALPQLNYTFRIRYGIILLVPTTLLLAWALGRMTRLPRAARWVVAALFFVQLGLNGYRSMQIRAEFGDIELSIDRVYTYVDTHDPDANLLLMNDFLNYDYHPDASPALQHKSRVGSYAQVSGKHTLVISWVPSYWEEVELVASFSGQSTNSPFDRLWPYPVPGRTYLMRFIDKDDRFRQANDRTNRGDLNGAAQLLQDLLVSYPGSMAARLELALLACRKADWARADELFANLESIAPEDEMIRYNRGFSMENSGQDQAAVARLKSLVDSRFAYSAMVNLAVCYDHLGQTAKAAAERAQIARRFPKRAATL
jgi:tetratricopeptide (TPR) repeat protein